MEVVFFLVLAATAFAIWRFIKRSYQRSQFRRLTRQGDPMISGVHKGQMSRDWYSLGPELRAGMAADFLKDPGRVYAIFASGGSDLQRPDFDEIMRGLIASDPACSHISRGGAPD